VGNLEPAIELMGDVMQQAIVEPRARAHRCTVMAVSVVLIAQM